VSPRLKVLSGQQVAQALRSLGFSIAKTRGSHAKLTRTTASGERQVLTVPLHKELAPGTLQAIYRQALKFVAAENLRPHFFHD
jgi:predicted RNA binding protein YcfA (HicA-like mRNA interferase family)